MMSNLKDAKTLVLQKFDYLRELNKSLAKDLYSHGIKNNAMDHPFKEGEDWTIRTGIETLKSFSKLLSDEYRVDITFCTEVDALTDCKIFLEHGIEYHEEIKAAFKPFFIQDTIKQFIRMGKEEV